MYVLIVVILVVLYKLATWNVSSQEEYMYGFWTAEGDDFCEESEIDAMMVMIGTAEPTWWSVQRTCHIIIMNDISNQGFTLKYHTGWAGIGVSKYRVHCEVEFEDEQIWPENVVLEIDMQRGTLCVWNGDVMYARLNKQHEITNCCLAADGAELVSK
jgi:hypothetical protein